MAVSKLIGNFSIQFKANIGRFTKDMRKASKVIGATGASASLLTKTFLSLAAGFYAVKMAMRAFAVGWNFMLKAVQESAEFERIQVRLEALVGNVEVAKNLFDELTTFALKTPFTVKESFKAATQMVAMGESAEKVVHVLGMIGDVSAATGADLQHLAFVFEQVRTEGKVLMRDVRQFGTMGIPIVQMIADIYGVAVRDVGKLTESGVIGIEAIIEAFQRVTTGAGQYAGLMDRVAKTISGRWARMADQIQLTMKMIGDEIVHAFNLDDLIEDAFQALQRFRTGSKDTVGAIAEWLRNRVINMADVFDLYVKIMAKMISGVAKFVGMVVEIVEGIYEYMRMFGIIPSKGAPIPDSLLRSRNISEDPEERKRLAANLAAYGHSVPTGPRHQWLEDSTKNALDEYLRATQLSVPEQYFSSEYRRSPAEKAFDESMGITDAMYKRISGSYAGILTEADYMASQTQQAARTSREEIDDFGKSLVDGTGRLKSLGEYLRDLARAANDVIPDLLKRPSDERGLIETGFYGGSLRLVEDMIDSIESKAKALLSEGPLGDLADAFTALEATNFPGFEFGILKSQVEEVSERFRIAEIASEAAKIIEDIKTPEQLFADRKDRLQEIYDAGSLTGAQFLKAVAKAKEDIFGATPEEKGGAALRSAKEFSPGGGGGPTGKTVGSLLETQNTKMDIQTRLIEQVWKQLRDFSNKGVKVDF